MPGRETNENRSIQQSLPLSFDGLFERYHDAVFRQILLQVREHVMAEDVSQETWLRVSKSLHKFEGRSGFFSWVCSIAANEAKRKWKKARPYQQLDEHARHPEHNPTAGREINEDVRLALQKVPEIYRQPLVLELWEGWSLKEISEALDVPVGTVKSRLHRAREKFREVWTELNPE